MAGDQRNTVAYLLGGGGLLTVVVGSFLPWLQSGEVRRNSYAAFGVLRRLIGFEGLPATLTRAWPLLGLCCAVVVVATAAGLVRIAAASGLVTAAWSAIVSGAALAWQSTAGVWVVPLGPGLTVMGDTAVMIAAILTLISRTRRAADPRSPR